MALCRDLRHSIQIPVPRFLTQRNCEIISVCYLKQLSFGVLCYTATDFPLQTPGYPYKCVWNELNKCSEFSTLIIQFWFFFFYQKFILADITQFPKSLRIKYNHLNIKKSDWKHRSKLHLITHCNFKTSNHFTSKSAVIVKCLKSVKNQTLNLLPTSYMTYSKQFNLIKLLQFPNLSKSIILPTLESVYKD